MNFSRFILKTLRLSGLLACLLILTQPSYAEESAKFEKIRDTPDGKFAVRVSCSSEPEDPNNIDSSLITAVEVVSLPSKKVVVNFAEVSYIDSSAIGELISGYSTLSKVGGQLKLMGLSKRVKDLLLITKNYTIFDIHDTEAAAMGSFK